MTLADVTIIIIPFGFSCSQICLYYLAFKYFVFSLPDEGYSINAPRALYYLYLPFHDNHVCIGQPNQQ